MQRRPLTVRFRQAGRPERQTARQKRQNYAPQNKNGRGVRRGSAQRAPLLNPCSRPRAGGEPPQWENQTDKGVVRPAARSARTRPRRTCSIFLLRWGTGGPLTDRRAAPGPTRAGGVWLVQIPPASRSPRLARGSHYPGRVAVGLCRSCRKPHPVDHRLTLDPYGLAYSLLRSRAFTPKVVPGARLDNRVPSASPVQP